MDGQLIGNVGINGQVVVPPALAAKERLMEQLSTSIQKWGDSPFIILVQLLGGKVLTWFNEKVDDVLKKHPKATRYAVGLLAGLVGLGYGIVHFNKNRAAVADWFMSYAMYRINVSASEYNMNRNLPSWVRKHGYSLRKETTLTVHRNSPHLSDDPASSTTKPDDLFYTGTNTWIPFFHKFKFFVLRENEKKKKPEDENGQNIMICSWCNNSNRPGVTIYEGCSNDMSADTEQCDKSHSLWCLWFSNKPIKAVLDAVNNAENKKKYVEVFNAVIHPPQYTECVWADQPHLPPRCLESVYLDYAVKARLVNDIAEYVHPESQKFYSDRGIPYRRGYLLYGRPGCGKTSFAKAIAAKFQLKIYVLPLLAPGMTDDMLQTFFRQLSAGCLLLPEDVDCAGLNRGIQQVSDLSEDVPPQKKDIESGTAPGDWGNTTPVVVGSGEALEAPSDENPSQEQQLLLNMMQAQTNTNLPMAMMQAQASNNLPMAMMQAQASNNLPMAMMLNMMKANEAQKQTGPQPEGNNATKKTKKKAKPRSMVTLAGLLNAIDGVASPQGYVLMMTTNYKDALDPALVRAGRVDMKIEFDRATQEQARALFINMYKLVKTDDKDWTPPYNENTIPALADDFAAKVPPRKVTCAQLQQFVLLHKTEPQVAVNEIADWIKEELQDEEKEQEEDLEQDTSHRANTQSTPLLRDVVLDAAKPEESEGSGAWQTAMEIQIGTSTQSDDDPQRFARKVPTSSSSLQPPPDDLLTPSSSPGSSSGTTPGTTPPSNDQDIARNSEATNKLLSDHWKQVDTTLESQTEEPEGMVGWGQVQAQTQRDFGSSVSQIDETEQLKDIMGWITP